MIYLYTLLTIIILSGILKIIFNKKDKLYKKVFLIASCIILTTISAIRYNVGNDFANYESLFDRVLISPLFTLIGQEHYEIGYILLNKIISLFTTNSQCIFVVTSIIVNVLIFYAIYRYSKMPLMSIIVYICLNLYTASFNTIRQYIAIGIILLGIKYIIDRKFWKFLLIVILAAIFHKSVLIFLLFYFIADREINVKNIIAYIFVGAILLVFINTFSNIFINLFYADYSGLEMLNSKLDFGLTIIVPLILAGISVIGKSKIIDKDKEMRNHVN